jgi:hypothetical protein
MSDILALPEQKPVLSGQQLVQIGWDHRRDGTVVALMIPIEGRVAMVELAPDEARKLCCNGIYEAGKADDVKAKNGKVIVGE